MTLLNLAIPYVNCIRRDGYYECYCPFHDAETATMRLFPQSDEFSCTTCGLNGDKATFGVLLRLMCKPERLCVYVLKLDRNKFYVGLTAHLHRRLIRHWMGNASLWTMKYPPVELVEVFQHGTPKLENQVTLDYMGRYGHAQVRGGCHL